MISIPACTGFLVRSDKKGYYTEIDPKRTSDVVPGSVIETRLPKGLVKGTVVVVDDRLGQVTARLADGSTLDLPFNMFRLAQHNENSTAQPLPVYDPKGDFWFKIAIGLFIFGFLSLFANVFLLCRRTSSQKQKPVAKRSRSVSPRRYRSRDNIQVVVGSPESSQTKSSSAWSVSTPIPSALKTSKSIRRRHRRNRRTERD